MNGRDIIAALGLGIGAAFGMAGVLVQQAQLRQAFWLVDGIALVVAASLLTVKYLRKGSDSIAAGFLVFAIAEGLLLSATAAGLTGNLLLFGIGFALWAAALLLTSTPREFPFWGRAAGIVAAVLFGVVAYRIFRGLPLLPTAKPLPFYAYPFLVIAIVGWIWALLTERPAVTEKPAITGKPAIPEKPGKRT